MSGLGDNAITSISCAAYRENCPSNTVPVRIERLCLVKKTFALALIIKNSLDEDWKKKKPENLTFVMQDTSVTLHKELKVLNEDKSLENCGFMSTMSQY